MVLLRLGCHWSVVTMFLLALPPVSAIEVPIPETPGSPYPNVSQNVAPLQDISHIISQTPYQFHCKPLPTSIGMPRFIQHSSPAQYQYAGIPAIASFRVGMFEVQPFETHGNDKKHYRNEPHEHQVPAHWRRTSDSMIKSIVHDSQTLQSSASITRG